VAIGSRAGETRPAGLAAYAATKAAEHALVQVIAAELRGSGVTVNAILPGTIDTPANRSAMPDADRSGWVAPAQIADAMLFLCSDAAAQITGSFITMGS
jgi:NAD(P)-dependent dehydrogenase (short-subunit alcohol dehydrogenase family)